MDGGDVIAARDTLGAMWGAGRPLQRPELARALGLSAKHGGDNILNIENGKTGVSGPIDLLLRLYLAGVTPPDTVEIFREKSRRRVNAETGVMPPACPRKPRAK